MLGFLKIAKASRNATEVWVNPAALIIKPLYLFLASCIVVTISPSIFDWVKSTLIPNFFEYSLHLFFKSSYLIVPYCYCSLSPNRLRFGPLITIILFFIKPLYIMKKINKIKIKLNGKYITIHDKITLFNLVKKTKVPANKVAIELNKEIVNKKSLNKIKIKKNDKIEIVHFIGGG